MFHRACQTDSFPISATNTSSNECYRTAAEREVRPDSYKSESDQSIEKGVVVIEISGSRYFHVTKPQTCENRNFFCPFVSAAYKKGLHRRYSARQIANKFAFALAYSYLWLPEDTPARQCSNKFDIALAYSYLCHPKPTWDRCARSADDGTPAMDATSGVQKRHSWDSTR